MSEVQGSKHVQSLLNRSVSVLNEREKKKRDAECCGIVAVDEELFFPFITRKFYWSSLLKTAYSQSVPTFTPSACQTTLFHCQQLWFSFKWTTLYGMIDSVNFPIYNMASSVCGQDERISMLWLATQVSKMALSCPFGITRWVPQKKVFLFHRISL